MILKDTKLCKELDAFKKKNTEVEDIILFGSTIRGKTKPNDTDILVIFKTMVHKEIEYQIRRIIEKKYLKVSIISKTRKTMLDPGFAARESILFEGKSLIFKKNIGEEYGFTPFGMFKYNFQKWDKLRRTKFYYALNGRNGGKGIIDNYKGIKLSDAVILIPLENIEPFRDFLEEWKLEYKYIPTLIPQRLGKKGILV